MGKSQFQALIRAGKLPMGTELHHVSMRYPDRRVTATVVKDGISLRGEVHASPSGAAKSVTGNAVDGWTFWRLPDGQRLDALRSDNPLPG
jgi:hypothetical protein